MQAPWSHIPAKPAKEGSHPHGLFLSAFQALQLATAPELLLLICLYGK